MEGTGRKLRQDCWLGRVQGEGETTSPSLSDASKIMTAERGCIGQNFPKNQEEHVSPTEVAVPKSRGHLPPPLPTLELRLQ